MGILEDMISRTWETSPCAATTLDVVKTGDLVVTHVPTEDMVADFLTKMLPRTKHQKCTELSGMSHISEN